MCDVQQSNVQQEQKRDFVDDYVNCNYQWDPNFFNGIFCELGQNITVVQCVVNYTVSRTIIIPFYRL